MKRSLLIGIVSLVLALTASAQMPHNQTHRNSQQKKSTYGAYRGANGLRQAAPQPTFSNARFRQPAVSSARLRETAYMPARMQSRTNTSFMERSPTRSAALPKTSRPAISNYLAGPRLSPRLRATSAFESRSDIDNVAARRQGRPASERDWTQSTRNGEARTNNSLLKPFRMNDTAALRPRHAEFNDRWATTYFKGQTRSSFVNGSGAATAAIPEQRRAAFSNNWRGGSFAGRQYWAFRNYQSAWHDSSWWNFHCNRLVFVTVFSQPFPFYFDAGYWYPAWGYYPEAYYPYDGPIYCYNDLPPDEIIANVQIELYNQGYYSGPIDGIIGPDTQAAIADYQADQGLPVTAAIDEPTVESLGLV